VGKSKFEEVLMPSGVSFPADEQELLADLTLAFTYGLSTGICRPEYGERLLRYFALKGFWFMELLTKAAGRNLASPVELAEAEWGDFQTMARNMQEALPLD